ncbi:Bud20 protein [Martiniozyma asiatica (nom. inval.)]|nr:Bud20 protein [Martiniozyma asiatica]
MGRYSVKRYKTKRRTKDLDLIHQDLSNANTIQQLKHQPEDEYRPGLGQYYCIHCDRYFQNNKALAAHLKGKVHKRRVKELKVNPYSNLEAEAANGQNLEKFVEKVNQYNLQEPGRKDMETALLTNLIAENDEKDRLKWEEMYPEEAEAQRKKLAEDEAKNNSMDIQNSPVAVNEEDEIIVD